jgi:hypothetical protein
MAGPDSDMDRPPSLYLPTDHGGMGPLAEHAAIRLGALRLLLSEAGQCRPSGLHRRLHVVRAQRRSARHLAANTAGAGWPPVRRAASI